MRGEKTMMRTETIKQGVKLDMELAWHQWTVSEWIRFCVRNNLGIIIEDGRVVGYETRPATIR